MEVVIYILMILILLNTILKLSFWDWKALLGMGLFLGGFILIIYPYAIEQSQTQIDVFFQSSEILGNMAVLVSLEAGLCMAFCFLALSYFYQNKSGMWLKVLKFYPCLLVFPTAFYGLTQAIFGFTGVDFFTIASIFAVVLSCGVPMLSYGIKTLIPEQDLRLEIHLMLSLLVTILGLVSTANGKVVYASQGQNIDFRMLIFILLGGVFLCGIGFFFNKFWWSYQSRKNKL